MNLQPINSIEDFHEAICHPYRIGEFFTDETQIFEVSEDNDENEALIDNYLDTYGAGNLFYGVNWEDRYLYIESGLKIRSVY